MRHNKKTRKVRGSTRDYSRNLSVRMTEEQYQRLRQYMKLTRLNSTAYFCCLIRGDNFRGRSPKLNHALHASVNMIYSNMRQITRHRYAKDLDAKTVAKLDFLMDKICEEIYLLATQK